MAIRIGDFYITRNNPRELLKTIANKQNQIDKVVEILENRQNNLFTKEVRKTLDDDVERALNILKGVTINVR